MCASHSVPQNSSGMHTQKIKTLRSLAWKATARGYLEAGQGKYLPKAPCWRLSLQLEAQQKGNCIVTRDVRPSRGRNVPECHALERCVGTLPSLLSVPYSKLPLTFALLPWSATSPQPQSNGASWPEDSNPPDCEPDIPSLCSLRYFVQPQQQKKNG